MELGVCSHLQGVGGLCMEDLDCSTGNSRAFLLTVLDYLPSVSYYYLSRPNMQGFMQMQLA